MTPPSPSSSSLSAGTVSALLAAFRGPGPAPGATAASALAAAMGASLLARAGARPPRVNASSQDRARLRDATVRATAFADHLLRLMDDDRPAVAEGAARTPDMEVALEVLRACAAAVKSAIALSELSAREAAADVQVALELLEAAAGGARRRVEAALAKQEGDANPRIAAECTRLDADTERDSATARRQLMG